MLDDAHDEGSERLTLTLSSPSGAYLADGVATGTITNTYHMPQAWIARFGRTVADQVLDAVDGRLRAARSAGTSIALAGQRIGGAASKAAPKAAAASGAKPAANSGAAAAGSGAKPSLLFGGTAAADAEETARLKALSDWLSQKTEEKDRALGRSRTLIGQQVLMGSSFSLAAQTGGGGFAALWGRMAQARFAGREDSLSVGRRADWTPIGTLTSCFLAIHRGQHRVLNNSDFPEAVSAMMRGKPGGMVLSMCSTVPGHSTSPRGA